MRSLEAVARLRGEFPGLVVPTFLGAHAVPGRISRRSGGLCRSRRVRDAAGRDRTGYLLRRVLRPGRVFRRPDAPDFRSRPALGSRPAHPRGRAGGDRAADLAAEYQAASADHLIQVTLHGIECLAQAGVVATLLPGTSFCLGHDSHAPARAFINSGITVALATDCNPGTCFTENMQLIIGLACITLRMSVEEAVTAATMGGARALRLEREVGSLEVGKRADLIVLNAESYMDIPYHIGVNLVRFVVAGGRQVIEASRPVLRKRTLASRRPGCPRSICSWTCLQPGRHAGFGMCCRLDTGHDVRLLEVLTLEQQGFAGYFRQRVGEAISEIQSCRVATFTEIVEGLDGRYAPVRR